MRVIITGASRGIGKALAVAFSKRGAKLVLTARFEHGLLDTKSLVKEAVIVAGSVADLSTVKEVFHAAEQAYNGFDVVVNNAGVAVRKPLIDHSDEDFNLTMDVNVKGVFYYCREAAKRNPECLIINVSSGAGKHGYPGLSVYCASKFAVIGLTESLAGEHKGKVLAVCPGPTNTEMYRSLFPGQDYSRIDAAETVAERIVKVCEHADEFPSGMAIDVWRDPLGQA